MIYLFIIMMIVVVILFNNYAKQTSTRWIILTLLLVCAGILSFAIQNTALPSLAEQGESGTALYAFLENADRGLLFLCGEAAYTTLMFAIVYGERTSHGWLRTLAIALPLPIMVLDLLHPIGDTELNDTVLLSVQNLYTLSGAALLLFGTFKEQNLRKRKERTVTSLALVPPILFGGLFCLLAILVNSDSEGYERYVYFSAYASIAVFIAIFLILVFRYGVFGIRIVLHKQMLDQTVKGIASGTTMMNHAIKNHATNIQLLTRGMKRSYEPFGSGEELDLVLSESQQIMNMVKRIQSQIEDIAIKREPSDLTRLVENALLTQRHRIGGRAIEVVKQWSESVTVVCDKVHMQEVFYNIVQNAFDAIGEAAGTVQVRIERTRKQARIEVTDSGAGIAKGDIERIFDPFFSTKHGDHHFGLGLSYCYLVVQKHGGTIEALSQKGAGTTVTVTLPLPRKQARIAIG